MEKDLDLVKVKYSDLKKIQDKFPKKNYQTKVAQLLGYYNLLYKHIALELFQFPYPKFHLKYLSIHLREVLLLALNNQNK